jgi:hypothetical protein
MRDSSGRFVKGTSSTYSINCSVCSTVFIAKTGSAKYCKECIYSKCKECQKPVYLKKSFCSPSCRSKYSYKNNDKVRNIIQNGRLAAFTQEARDKISKAQTGKPKLKARKHYVGLTLRQERHLMMSRVEYKEWRKFVFKRDDYTCMCCNKRGSVNLIADHIIPYYMDKTKCYDTDNGVTVCFECNKYLPTTGHTVKTTYQELLTELKNKGLSDYINNPQFMVKINFTFANAYKYGK